MTSSLKEVLKDIDRTLAKISSKTRKPVVHIERQGSRVSIRVDRDPPKTATKEKS